MIVFTTLLIVQVYNHTQRSILSDVLSEDTPLIVGLEATLGEISAAARSIRQLADVLERHSKALIGGKGGPGGK